MPEERIPYQTMGYCPLDPDVLKDTILDILDSLNSSMMGV